MTEQQAEQENRSDQDTWSGRTCPEHIQATRERTSDVSSKKSAKSQKEMFQFLDLRKTSGGGQGAIMGDGYSVAWRTLDAQYWGVPQRRKRIYLVADFGGNTAPKILFEREGLSGNFTESREAWQRTAGDIKTGTHKTGTDDVECYDISDRRRVADKSEVSPTLTTKMGTGGNNVPIVLENHPQDSRVTIAEDGNVPTLTSRMGTGGGNVPLILSQSHCRSEADARGEVREH